MKRLRDWDRERKIGTEEMEGFEIGCRAEGLRSFFFPLRLHAGEAGRAETLKPQLTSHGLCSLIIVNQNQ